MDSNRNAPNHMVVVNYPAVVTLSAVLNRNKRLYCDVRCIILRACAERLHMRDIIAGYYAPVRQEIVRLCIKVGYQTYMPKVVPQVVSNFKGRRPNVIIAKVVGSLIVYNLIPFKIDSIEFRQEYSKCIVRLMYGYLPAIETDNFQFCDNIIT